MKTASGSPKLATPKLATPEEAADFLRSSTGALAQDRYRGRGPKFIKHGRAVLYSWEALREYVDQNTFQSTEARPGAA